MCVCVDSTYDERIGSPGQAIEEEQCCCEYFAFLMEMDSYVGKAPES